MESATAACSIPSRRVVTSGAPEFAALAPDVPTEALAPADVLDARSRRISAISDLPIGNFVDCSSVARSLIWSRIHRTARWT